MKRQWLATVFLGFGIALAAGVIASADVIQIFEPVWEKRKEEPYPRTNEIRHTDINGNESAWISLPAKNGNITFNHRQHANDFKCDVCHGRGTPGTIAINKDFAHRTCKGCHAKSAAGPTKCGDCHKK